MTTTRTHIVIPALVVLLLLPAGMVYYFADPAETTWMPQCFFHRLTGLDCPGCGAQRMIHSLLHGNLTSAWEANPFLLIMLPVVAFLLVLELLLHLLPDRVSGFYRKVYGPATAPIAALLLVAWFVARNFLL